jgi:hypothetical protein
LGVGVVVVGVFGDNQAGDEVAVEEVEGGEEVGFEEGVEG